MASYRLITDEDKEYISSFMDWLNENVTPAQVDQEHFANCIMNIDNLMRFGSGGMDTSDENAVLPVVIESALPCPFCGGTNLAFISDIDGSRDVEFIVCMADDCLADGRIGKNKKDALNKWNKRHSI